VLAFFPLHFVSHAEESELKEGVSLEMFACSLITVEDLKSGGAFLVVFLTYGITIDIGY